MLICPHYDKLFKEYRCDWKLSYRLIVGHSIRISVEASVSSPSSALLDFIIVESSYLMSVSQWFRCCGLLRTVLHDGLRIVIRFVACAHKRRCLCAEEETGKHRLCRQGHTRRACRQRVEAPCQGAQGEHAVLGGYHDNRHHIRHGRAVYVDGGWRCISR